MILFCFDRDRTVSTSNGPVPLEWVRALAHESPHQVWATGNQRLRDEADIPGFRDIGVEERSVHARHARRIDRLWSVAQHVYHTHGAPEQRIVVDDADVSVLEERGWIYYEPQEFVDEYEGRFREEFFP